MPKISVAIPTSEMGGKGAGFLRYSLNCLAMQTFKDFEVVISDNSDNDDIQNICTEFPNIDINYFKNPVKGMAPNSNEAIKASKGELIKILYLDDFLAVDMSLEEIVKNFKESDMWMVTGCLHTRDGKSCDRPHYPEYNQEIWTGKNTIGSPSVLTVRNSDPLLFDPTLTWLLDCDLYKRYYDKFGEPKILNTLNVVIRQGEHQMTNILSDEVKQREYDYLIKKYN